ncbi:MAG: sulfotransferase [Paracoccaceae bacterium]
MRLPNFLIVGAMKCGTTTLQAQLAAQPGIFMATPKEPNFFSDDLIYARGMDWYSGLFAAAEQGDLCGEASTNYTKLPNYPHCAERICKALPDVRLIYMVRDPVARTVSHFVHEWTMGRMSLNFAQMLETHPELVSYSCYARQISPYVKAFGADRILLVGLEDLENDPRFQLGRIGAFLGLPVKPVWQDYHARENVSSERLRKFLGYGLLIEHPLAQSLRRGFIPQRLRNAVKERLRMGRRPEVPPHLVQRLQDVFAEDQAALGKIFQDRALPRSVVPRQAA